MVRLAIRSKFYLGATLSSGVEEVEEEVDNKANNDDGEDDKADVANSTLGKKHHRL